MFKMSSKCLKCSRKLDPFAALTSPDAMHVDHVVPRSKGGIDHLSNYQPLCRTCNVRKGNRSNADYRTDAMRAKYPTPSVLSDRSRAKQAAREAFLASPAQVAKRAAEDARRAAEAERLAEDARISQVRTRIREVRRRRINMLVSGAALLFIGALIVLAALGETEDASQLLEIAGVALVAAVLVWTAFVAVGFIVAALYALFSD